MKHEKIRCGFYKLLSDCYHIPDEELMKQLAGMETAGNMRNAARINIESGDVEELILDYSRLFVGPYQLLAPPYGSVYMENGNTVIGNSTLDAVKLYRDAGLEISGNFKQPPDHIAVELEFMYYLILKELEAVEKSDYDTASAYLEQQKVFIKRHLGVWLPEFAERVEKEAQTRFYRDIAKSTKEFVEEDIRYLEE
ncbi:MAG: molecular chaperone TorD family protein [Candidatus Methanoperedens sp.]|nr:molecular chaperone TorD family protein [Candidatus Methanoperedens sp.]